MRIGLIDVDGHNYPNLALMKISAWHKAPREIKDLQRWCNNRFIFRSCPNFDDYKKEVIHNG
jgi:hypothetical protein